MSDEGNKLVTSINKKKILHLKKRNPPVEDPTLDKYPTLKLSDIKHQQFWIKIIEKIPDILDFEEAKNDDEHVIVPTNISRKKSVGN